MPIRASTGYEPKHLGSGPDDGGTYPERRDEVVKEDLTLSKFTSLTDHTKMKKEVTATIQNVDDAYSFTSKVW